MKARRSFPVASLEFRPLKGVGEDEAWAVDTTLLAAQSMEKILKRLKFEERLHHKKILEIWPELVGEFNAQHSFPESLKKKVLTVRVSNSPYLYQLTMLKSELLNKLQKRYGKEKIMEIRLSL